MTLSEVAWQKITPTFNKIIKHSFTQEIVSGELSKNKFAYYMEQDTLYLKDFTKCLDIISQEISEKYKKDFIEYSKSTLEYVEYVEQYFANYPQYVTNLTTISTEGYTGRLIKICTTKTVEEALAAINQV